LPFLKADHKLLERLLIFPTCAASFFSFKDGHWQNEYEEKLSEKEKEKIFSTFEKAFRETNYEHPKKVYGEIIEDRGSQISFSAFGQEAPIDVKKIWDPDGKKRLVIIDVMKKYAPEFEIRVGGSTTIDVTHKGIDKAYGVRKIEEVTKIPIKDMVFVGDKLQPGGNDYPARLTGVDWIEVGNVLETKKLIQEILKNGNL
jgi:HAD superfamily hydrolase (TIGR01484 family)